MQDSVTIDDADLKLLSALQDNGALTNQQLADAVRLSPSQCSRRRQRLEQAGVIRRYRADLDPALLGFGITVFIFVALATHSRNNARRFRDLVAALAMVQETHALTGDSDYLLKVVVAKKAYERALSLGAEPGETNVGPMELAIPAIKGIGGSLLYFVDRYGEKGSIWDVDFVWTGERDPKPEKCGLHYLDHLTHNVLRGRMDHWAGWYQRLFNFREIRFFNIEGKLTGLISRAMTSPCCKIRIPINESLDDKSQIEEYLREYKGEGIQHVAMGCRDIYESVAKLGANGLPFMPQPPATYYEKIDARVPGHGEEVAKLKASGVLIDGEGVVDGGMTKVLLQIFSGTVLGPIFFEFIQRKGDDGFGEGNFRALFESIEEDQIRRGVLKEDAA